MCPKRQKHRFSADTRVGHTHPACPASKFQISASCPEKVKKTSLLQVHARFSGQIAWNWCRIFFLQFCRPYSCSTWYGEGTQQQKISAPHFFLLGKNKALTPTLPRIRYMSCFDLNHAPVASTARAAATGPVSMSTRPDPEGSDTVEITTRPTLFFGVPDRGRGITKRSKNTFFHKKFSSCFFTRPKISHLWFVSHSDLNKRKGCWSFSLFFAYPRVWHDMA